ncbi:hypothetical protein BJ322DRAFT_1005403 [Thelephora terrestris]|uniref:Uncharacterized protein n=1 Tax=Thelephora terrestris TaxID=56493 RepID=A0A9P6L7A0_9AGAM|nr:hypothetical protein BJ322DRAFT_1005403 [Thelephora terrestris]
MPNHDGGSGREFASGSGGEKGPEDPEFHPTPGDIAFVRSIFPLPAELVTEILDLAEYWAYSRVICSDEGRFHDANTRYLQSNPIQGGDFEHPLRRLVVTTHSKDQGWSSYPENRGTRDNSWTWFELTLDDGETDDEIVRVEVMRNIHAGSVLEEYRATIEDERILKQAKKGDRLSVWVRAMFPGWCNEVRSAKIEAWAAC